jgi:hypothetical protein
VKLPKVKALFLIGMALILSVPFFSDGALEIPLQSSDISVEMIPENPQPYQQVTVSLQSYSTDLNKANIVWRNASKVIQSGFGKTSYTFTALGPDIPLVFDITITPEGSIEKVTKRIVVSPSEIDVLWEAVDGYTPPFYKGKSFASAEGVIKTVAIPSSNKGNVSYTWKSNSNTVLSASGFNKDSYVFKNSELSTKEKVTVNASSVNGTYNATRSIDIPIVSPKIIFYKKTPLEGILYNQALTNESFVSEDELTLVAEPYFLALNGNETNFTYDWKINGESIATPSKKTELTVRPSERGGYATISLMLENLNTLFQKVTAQIRVNL